jgi:hyperosmotically inducible protein
MKLTSPIMTVVPMLALTLAFAGWTFAQSASESFHNAGEATEDAGSSVGDATESAYHGTATATKDTAITTNVKSSLLGNDLTRGGGIHVTTVEGVVTLRGTVASDKVAGEARHIAETTGGVKSVVNKLHVSSAS